MLTALQQGVKGGKWFSLMHKVYALPNLRKAFERVKANGGAAGVDHVTAEGGTPEEGTPQGALVTVPPWSLAFWFEILFRHWSKERTRRETGGDSEALG